MVWWLLGVVATINLVAVGKALLSSCGGFSNLVLSRMLLSSCAGGQLSSWGGCSSLQLWCGSVVLGRDFPQQ